MVTEVVLKRILVVTGLAESLIFAPETPNRPKCLTRFAHNVANNAKSPFVHLEANQSSATSALAKKMHQGLTTETVSPDENLVHLIVAATVAIPSQTK